MIELIALAMEELTLVAERLPLEFRGKNARVIQRKARLVGESLIAARAFLTIIFLKNLRECQEMCSKEHQKELELELSLFLSSVRRGHRPNRLSVLARVLGRALKDGAPRKCRLMSETLAELGLLRGVVQEHEPSDVREFKMIGFTDKKLLWGE